MFNSYRQEDVHQILQLAIARQVESDELTRTQLMEIAAELGISPTDLHLAEQEWLSQRGELKERDTFIQMRRGKVKQHATRYAIVNTFLVLTDLAISGGLGWSLYVLLPWGLGLALNAWKGYQTRGEDYEYAFQKWRRQRQIKQSVDTLISRVLKAIA
ncbi:2TM domain-containing protein [Oculatella sp. LEGE 06141]|uniref:2TM domain-containing protein n=1 Tax=Oculatella sp. LEGE 06141 TaxID=1828648 RepID=UPI00188193E3|nr:2TM domain-containing protein [Oculatella sp. LEGE 06141]MBE9182190.1 2TM domain-containing protein [Oculatella sp. LEGE 06141]